MLELGQWGEVSQSGIGDVAPTEVEVLELCQWGEVSQPGIGDVFASCKTQMSELTKTLQLAQFNQHSV
ncbi:MAG: hypothetical protein NZ703_15600, partial [Gemmataceae bacterium]|nr:hypothetical protein [Gemmataceae bacterium]